MVCRRAQLLHSLLKLQPTDIYYQDSEGAAAYFACWEIWYMG